MGVRRLNSQSALRCLLLLAAICFVPEACAARLALVIGNDRYAKINPLRNAVADAQSMAQALKQVGYDVELRTDLDLRSMRDVVRMFKAKVQQGDEVVFFFSGHGTQIENANFLLPIDIRGAESADQVRDDSLALHDVLTAMEERKARFSLMIIDACRNNPFPSKSRFVTSGGLTAAAPVEGQMIIFSAGTNQTALDRLGDQDPVKNGVFTRVLLREMMVPGVAIRDVLQRVRESVVTMAKTVRHPQMPAIYDQALGSFYFIPPAPGQAPVAAVDPHANEIAMWTPLKACQDVAGVQSYLNVYPTGLFADLARECLRKRGVALVSTANQIPKQAGQTFRECDACPSMVVIAPGVIAPQPGADKSRPKSLSLDRHIAVGVFEVTFNEWDACVADGGCPGDIADGGWGRQGRPVINVSWNDAKAYVGWLSRKTGSTYRLLREAEWEFVARAGSQEAYPWGNDAGFDNANCMHCGAAGFAGKRTAEVGKFQRNAFGLHDVIGNAWEWVEDCEAAVIKSVSEPPTQPNCSTRVLRGGSFQTAATEATLERRRGATQTTRSPQNGFRVAREIQ